MTRLQQDASRALLHAERAWLEAYGWERSNPGDRWRHKSAPKLKYDYSVRDAIVFTRAEPLRYSSGYSKSLEKL